MKLYWKSFFSAPSITGENGVFYDFDRITRYFRNLVKHRTYNQVISDQTAGDLDLDEVFERIDRTTSCVGRQYLYAKLRTISNEKELLKFNNIAEAFEADPALAGRCRKYLGGLKHENGYYFEELFHGTHNRPGRMALVYMLSGTFALILLLALLKPSLILLLVPVYLVNFMLHYRNKARLNTYITAVGEFAKNIRTARRLAAEKKIAQLFPDRTFLEEVSKIYRRSALISYHAPTGNDLAVIPYMLTELIKCAFNFEIIAFHRFIGDIIGHRDGIGRLFAFIGEIDSAIAVASLRSEERLCKPVFMRNKILRIDRLVHPLIENCTTNSIDLDHRSILLTGSNMSGKTTFIRAVAINAILAQTLYACFAETYAAPFFRIYSSIRVTDDLSDKTSYFLEEVLIIKEFIAESQNGGPCLFILDEIFKGTNTVERIAAGKGILSYVNGPEHFVFVSTHDTELTHLLEDDGYALYHFCEKITDGQLTFDYKLQTGRLKTRNAIRILELYDYPDEIVADAVRTQLALQNSAS